MKNIVLVLFSCVLLVSCSRKLRHYLKGKYSDEWYEFSANETDVDLTGEVFEYKRTCKENVYVKAVYEFTSSNDYLVKIMPYDEGNCLSIPEYSADTFPGKYYVKDDTIYLESLRVLSDFRLNNMITEGVLMSSKILEVKSYVIRNGKKRGEESLSSDTLYRVNK